MGNLGVRLLVVLGGMLTASVAFGQDGSGMGSMGLVAIGSGLVMGMAALGATLGQGKLASSAVEGLSRNPESKDAMFLSFILGIVFMEFQALLGFVVAFMWLGKV